MSKASFAAAAVGVPLGVLALGASLWLWARFGMGVYFDAVMGALAGCF